MKAMGKGSVASLIMFLLNVGSGVVALGLALTVVLLVWWPVADGPMEVDAAWLAVGSTMTIPVSFSVDTGTHRVTAPTLGISDAEIRNARGSLRFPARGGPFFIANGLLILAVFGVALWVLGQLRAVFRTLRAGQPFVPANARRLRYIAFAVIGGELARSAVFYGENYYAMTRFAADGLRFHAPLDLNVFAIVNGLIILVIAEVFRLGTRLDEEQSLTI